MGEVGLGLRLLELVALDQDGQHRPGFAALVTSGEQSIPAVQSYGTDRSSHRIGVQLETTIVEEAG